MASELTINIRANDVLRVKAGDRILLTYPEDTTPGSLVRIDNYLADAFPGAVFHLTAGGKVALVYEAAELPVDGQEVLPL